MISGQVTILRFMSSGRRGTSSAQAIQTVSGHGAEPEIPEG